MSIDERVLRLESAFVTLTRLAENMDARMDRTGERMDNFDVKLAALADAQIRTENAMAILTTKQSELTTKMSELAEAQAHTDGRLDALIDIISNGRNDRE